MIDVNELIDEDTTMCTCDNCQIQDDYGIDSKECIRFQKDDDITRVVGGCIETWEYDELLSSVSHNE